MRAALVVSGLLVLALTGCDSTSASEIVIAPEEPQCHPWPSCTTWTTDSTLALPAKLSAAVKTGRHVVADFELSVAGESVRVPLKSGGRYRLELEGTEDSLIVRGPGGHGMTIPTISNGQGAAASGFRAREFRAGRRGAYDFIAGPLGGGSMRVRLYGM